jgi:type I restriction enzyme S subunit
VNVQGVDFLPELPQGWRKTPVRYATTCLDGRRVPLNGDERGVRQGEFPYWGANGVVDTIDEFIFDEPLVLLGEDGAPFFDKSKSVAFFVTGKIWVNNHIHVLRTTRDFDPRFVAYALNATDYAPWIDGSTRDKLTQDKMGSIPLPSPPLLTQRSIADFLDRETIRIDALVAAKELLIELLVEKRKAIIAMAVMRGLEPKVKLRDSGVAWLGEVPAHWGTERARWLFRERDLRSESGEEEMLTVSHLTGVTPRSEKDVNMFEAETNEGYKVCEPGDLVINTLWAWMGAMGIAPMKGIVSPAYHVYEPGPRYAPAYIDVLVRLPVFAKEVTRYSKGVWSSRLRLYPEGFFEACLPVPPMEEQRAIIGFIAKETAKLDKVRAATERTIALLKARRAALIVAAVTGKIDLEATA